jgi:hypothetical protein
MMALTFVMVPMGFFLFSERFPVFLNYLIGGNVIITGIIVAVKA